MRSEEVSSGNWGVLGAEVAAARLGCEVFSRFSVSFHSFDLFHLA